jgi:DNA-binding transcriptional regulator YiaG
MTGNSHIGEPIEALRFFVTKSRLSDQRVSELMGVAVETLRHWLTGQSVPRRQSLSDIQYFLARHRIIEVGFRQYEIKC